MIRLLLRPPRPHQGQAPTARLMHFAVVVLSLLFVFVSPLQGAVRSSYGAGPAVCAQPTSDRGGRSSEHEPCNETLIVALLGCVGFGIGGEPPSSPQQNRRTLRFKAIRRTFKREGLPLGPKGLSEIIDLVDRHLEFPLSTLATGGQSLRAMGDFDAARRASHQRASGLILPNDPMWTVEGLDELLLSLSADVPGKMTLKTLFAGAFKGIRGSRAPSTNSSPRWAKRQVKNRLEQTVTYLGYAKGARGNAQYGMQRPTAPGELEIQRAFLRSIAEAPPLDDLAGALGVDTESLLSSQELSQVLLDEVLKDRRGPISLMLIARLLLRMYPELPGDTKGVLVDDLDLT